MALENEAAGKFKQLCQHCSGCLQIFVLQYCLCGQLRDGYVRVAPAEPLEYRCSWVSEFTFKSSPSFCMAEEILERSDAFSDKSEFH